ncbi:MAG: DUF2835 family protein [Endozoicomonas sp. (ex Botrylloides leachii)]|nr:DUF2835 family protein [Endozoicomonas sp. (ex Botrylloides leachii)]
MPKAIFSVSLSSEQVLEFYKGLKNRVQVSTTDGQTMSLPYDILLQHMTREGIHGTFEITYASDGTLGALHRVS